MTMLGWVPFAGAAAAAVTFEERMEIAPAWLLVIPVVLAALMAAAGALASEGKMTRRRCSAVPCRPEVARGQPPRR